MERRYLAVADIGSGYVEFEYYSENRANSKANLEDAKKDKYLVRNVIEYKCIGLRD